MKLKVKKSRVLSAADKCPQAREALIELFPEAFEDSKFLDMSCVVANPDIEDGGKRPSLDFEKTEPLIWASPLEPHRLHLHGRYNWEVVPGPYLIPTKK